MRNITRFALLSVIASMAGAASAQQSDNAAAPSTSRVTKAYTTQNASATLFDNGTWITGIGNGFGGANTSEIEAGLTIFGYHVGTNGPAELADDFTIPSGQTWTFTSLKWHTYQTGGPTTGTTTAIFVRVWTVDPAGSLPGGHTYGNATTNRFQSMVFSNVYRVQNTTLTNTQRAVMEVSADLSFLPALGPGTYWLDVSVTGSASFSGPWTNVTVPWDATDNGRQAFAGGSFVVLNGGVGAAPTDFPFRVEGTTGCVGGSVNYCTSKTSTNGCTPDIAAAGVASIGAPAGWTATSTDMEDNKNAITFYGTTGPNAAPFQGSFLCVKAPLYRLPVKNTGGAALCSGSVSYTFADYLAHATGGPTIVAGGKVHSQTWGRDPGDPFTTQLSNGLETDVCP